MKIKNVKQELPFKNVALLPEDHKLLRELAELDQRSMTRQLSVIIRREHAELKVSSWKDDGVKEC
jgi:hypothetical protein